LPEPILRCQRSGEAIEKIATFLGGVAPIARQHREQVGFQFVLPATRCALIGLHVREQPAKVCGFLGNHPAVLVEVNRFVCHAVYLVRTCLVKIYDLSLAGFASAAGDCVAAVSLSRAD
jgi:hypothetical protein